MRKSVRSVRMWREIGDVESFTRQNSSVLLFPVKMTMQCATSISTLLARWRCEFPRQAGQNGYAELEIPLILLFLS